MTSKETYRIIDDIISKFDFEIVRSYMIINKWYWRNEKKSPSIDDMRYTATSLLIEVIKTSKKFDDDYTFCRTGGFKASYYPRAKEYILEFILEKKYTKANLT